MKDLIDTHRDNYDYLVGTFRDFDGQISFLDKLFKKHNVRTILDCGCGTGTHAILLAKKGYVISAFDYSKHMIDIAKEKASKNNVKITFYRGDIRKFNLGKYDAVISLFAPIMFACKNDTDLKSAISSMYDSTNTDGICLFETCTSAMLKGSGLEINKYAKKDFKVVRLAFYDFNPKRRSAKVRYVEVTSKGNKLKIDESEAEHKYYDKNTFEKIFKELKIKDTVFYGGFNTKNKRYDLFANNNGLITPMFIKK